MHTSLEQTRAATPPREADGASGDRLGYLVPEFPGQTHGFFWREVLALEALGIEVDLVSTRLPRGDVTDHDWRDAAINRTTFLYPPGGREMAGMLATWLGAGPTGWSRCLRTLLAAEEVDWPQRPHLMGLLAMGARLAGLARRRGWRHVHVHSCADAALVALAAHFQCGLPYSMTLHGSISGYGGLQRAKWSHAAFAIVISDAVRREAQQAVGDAWPQRVYRAPMGVDLDVFERTAPYVPHRSGQPLQIFSCGRLHPNKGFEELVQAVALLAGRGVDVYLRIGGADVHGGEYARQLRRLIGETGLYDRVTLCGGLSQPQVRDELEQAHLFALASRDEGLGVAIMEAMAMEVPVVATHVGGVPELVTHGEHGLLTPSRNPEAMAVAIEHLADNGSRCAAMGQAGRQRIAERFHSNLSAQVLLDQIFCTTPTGERRGRAELVS